MSRREIGSRNITVSSVKSTLLIVLVLSVVPGMCFALDINHVDIGSSMSHENGVPFPTPWSFEIYIGLDDANGLGSVEVVVPTTPPRTITLTDPDELEHWSGPIYATLQALQNAFPAGTYTVNFKDDQGGLIRSVSVGYDYAQLPLPTDLPEILAPTYNQVVTNLNPSFFWTVDPNAGQGLGLWLMDVALDDDVNGVNNVPMTTQLWQFQETLLPSKAYEFEILVWNTNPAQLTQGGDLFDYYPSIDYANTVTFTTGAQSTPYLPSQCSVDPNGTFWDPWMGSMFTGPYSVSTSTGTSTVAGNQLTSTGVTSGGDVYNDIVPITNQFMDPNGWLNLELAGVQNVELAVSDCLIHHVDRQPDDNNDLAHTMLLRKPNSVTDADVIGEYAHFGHLSLNGSNAPTGGSYGTVTVNPNNTFDLAITFNDGSTDNETMAWALDSTNMTLDVNGVTLGIGCGGFMSTVWLNPADELGVVLLVKKSSNKSTTNLAGEWLFQEYATDTTDGEPETFWGTLVIAVDGTFVLQTTANDGSIETASGVLDVEPDGDLTVNLNGQIFGQNIFRGVLSADDDVIVLAEGAPGWDAVGIGIAIRKPVCSTSPLYTLTTSVAGGQGTITPAGGSYPENQVVQLAATPAPAYTVQGWINTDNDASTAANNSVTMDADKTVTVDFAVNPNDPLQYTYPALLELTDGTVAGLVNAYALLETGVNDPLVNSDPNLRLLHVLADIGMLVLDTNDLAITTSVVEILAPFGVTFTGTTWETLDVNLPLDPADPNCLIIPPTADPDVARAAINNVILPQIDAILTELDLITDTPTPFSLLLPPTLTGLQGNLDIDYGDILALRAGLLAAKALLYGLANPAYDTFVDLANPLFAGYQCGNIPGTTTLTALLNAYPDLLKLLPTAGNAQDGAAALAQSKQHLINAANAFLAAVTYIQGETDVDPNDDLLQLPTNDPFFTDAMTNITALRDALVNNTSLNFRLGTRLSYGLIRNNVTVGRLDLQAGPLGMEGEGNLLFTDPTAHAIPWWDIVDFEIFGTELTAELETWTPGGYHGGWLEGTVSGDGSQIVNATMNWWGPSGPGQLAGLSGPRNLLQPVTIEIDPNPVFAGSAPRDWLPQLDPGDNPIPGTFGHGLGDDPTLGGVFPGQTQAGWIPQGYEVWAGNTDYRGQLDWERIYLNIDEASTGYVKLGESDGRTALFTGSYQYYVIAARGETQVDSILDPASGTYYNGLVRAVDTDDPNYVRAAPDGSLAIVGETGLRDPFGDTFTGALIIVNPGTWQGSVVITHTGQPLVAIAATSPVIADGTTPSNVTLTVTDEDNNVMAGLAPGYLQVSSTGAGVAVTQPTSATNAAGTTTASLTSSQVQTSTVSVELFGVLQTDTAAVDFTVGLDAEQLFTGQPEGPYAAGQTINAVPQVTIRDAQGRTVTDSTAQVTIALGANPGSGVLSGTLTRQAANGVATFDDLSINKAGTGYTLVASAAGLGNVTSDAFNVVAANASQLLFQGLPAQTPALGTLAPNPQIIFADAFGNRVLSANTPVNILISAGSGTIGAVLSGTTTVIPTNGVASFTDLKINRAGIGYQLTAIAGALNTTTLGFDITAQPALSIQKTDSADPVDPNDTVTYTVTYGNEGLAGVTNAVITEMLPQGLDYVAGSASNGGVYEAATRTLTWAIGPIGAETTDQVVTFDAKVSGDMAEGGTLTNSNLSLNSDQSQAVTQAVPETTTVNDVKAPAISGLIPAVNAEHAPREPLIQVHVTDAGSGVKYDGGTVTITVEGDVIYDGANETSVGVYDTRATAQAVKGVCRRTGSAADYKFSFTPSVTFNFEQKVDVVIDAVDVAGNPISVTYYFYTETRAFGQNAKVNSDDSALDQDHPATVVDSTGHIWVVWDQTTAAGDTDIYVGKLQNGASAFEASVAVFGDPNVQSHPVIAVDSSDTLYVAWQGQGANANWDIFCSMSADGSTWSAPVVVNGGDPNNTSSQRSPSIAIDGATPNQVYLGYEDDRAANWDIWLATSTDATTWAETQVTTHASDQVTPQVTVDPNDNVAYAVWTDSRDTGTNGTDIYGAASDNAWANLALVSTPQAEFSASGAVNNRAYLAWVANNGTLASVLYGDDSGAFPIVGTAMADEPNVVQASPSLVTHQGSLGTQQFAVWQDARNVNSNDDTDIYFAESGSPFGTNLLVNDDTGTSAQSSPSVNVDQNGKPYVVWVDERNGNKDIYYVGATAIGNPLPTAIVTNGTTVTVEVTTTANLEVEIPQLPEGIAAEDVTIAEVSNPPQMPSGADEVGLKYEFGPSGLEFDTPVTIRIPLTGDTSFSSYKVYRYDPNDLASPQYPWTESGIHNPAVKKTDDGGTTYYLEVEVDHFSIYGGSGITAAAAGGGGGGGGGCQLVKDGGGSPVEFFLPLILSVLAVLGWHRLDKRRHGRTG
jgi:uncharacterized repeat protein (TIGR01451 family)